MHNIELNKTLHEIVPLLMREYKSSSCKYKLNNIEEMKNLSYHTLSMI